MPYLGVMIAHWNILLFLYIYIGNHTEVTLYGLSRAYAAAEKASLTWAVMAGP